MEGWRDGVSECWVLDNEISASLLLRVLKFQPAFFEEEDEDENEEEEENLTPGKTQD